MIGAATGDHLHLRAAGLIKVVRLAERADLEFLDRLDWRGHYTGSHRAGLRAARTGEVLDVTDGVAGHIIRVVTAIYGKGVLIHVAAGNIASRRDARLEPEQRGCVATKIRQQLELL